MQGYLSIATLASSTTLPFAHLSDTPSMVAVLLCYIASQRQAPQDVYGRFAKCVLSLR